MGLSTRRYLLLTRGGGMTWVSSKVLLLRLEFEEDQNRTEPIIIAIPKVLLIFPRILN